MYALEGHSFSSIHEIADHYKIPYTTLLHRLDRDIPLVEAIKIRYVAHQSVVVNGKTFTSIAEACRKFNVPNTTALARYRRGWTPEQVFGLASKPKQVRNRNVQTKRSNPVTVKNKTYISCKAAAEAYSFPYQKFLNRLKKGLTPEQALELEAFPSWFIPGKGQFAAQRKKRRDTAELRSGKRICSVCSKEKPLEQFNKSSQGQRSYRCSTCTSKAFLRYRYGITVKQFEDLVTTQKGNCAICNKKLEINADGISRTKNVAVDHCHKTGKVRGVLCKNCNIALGFMGDSVENLTKAIEYLKQHR